MPDARDFNSRRPPRRKSWEENADGNDDNVDQNSDSRDDKPWRKQRDFGKSDAEAAAAANSDKNSGSRSDLDSGTDPATNSGSNSANDGNVRRPGRPTTSLSRAQGYDPKQAHRAAAGNASEEEAEAEPRAKTKKKRLFKLLGNEALCLIIIFGLISAFNWMATDYSGDYMGQSSQLRMVRLTIMRRAATIDAELSYSQLGVLELDQSKDQPAAQSDSALNLDFVTPEQWRRPGVKVWHARFKGKIKDGAATGTITDITGTYKVSLSKNVLTSLFTQMQAHIPRLPAVPLPALFDDKGKNLQGPAPAGLRTK